MRLDDCIRANREMWDSRTPVHLRSAMYDVAGFKAGRCPLTELEIAEVGDVSGKSLLHLMCHFGLDTLAWARKGAKVVGMDFSAKAVEAACALADELSIPARFVCCNLYDLPERLCGEFDVVFTSKGVLPWLPDIARWAKVASHFLKPGGVFYIYEFHPFAYVFDDAPEATEPRVKLPYFKTGQPLRFEGSQTYASDEECESRVSYEWPFALSDVVTSLINAGLRIEFLHEFPHSTYRSHAWLVKGADGLWRRSEKPDLPLMFSLRAVKE
jgi:SAM-dependent methyltransferase